MKVLLISLGCDKNLVDSEVMLGLLNKAGHQLTNDETFSFSFFKLLFFC